MYICYINNIFMHIKWVNFVVLFETTNQAESRKSQENPINIAQIM